MEGFCPLASGSKGNCIYLGTKETKILIDAGLSTRQTVKKLEEIGVGIEEIDAILITHEHTDHIKGLNVLGLKHRIPIYANSETAKGVLETLRDTPKFKIFSTGETFSLADLEIHPFSVQHDTLDPVMFTIRYNDIKMGFCTDIGFVTSLVRTHLRDCDYLYLESNHHVPLVHASARPYVYKQRVLSRHGHLSNEACGTLLREVAHPGLKKVYLAHLSGECNTPDIALNTVHDLLAQDNITLQIEVATQDQISTPTKFMNHPLPV